MTFNNNLILVGDGRLSSALSNSGVITFVMSTGSAMHAKKMGENARQVMFATPKIISYAADCWDIGSGIIERWGEDIRYVEK